MTVVRIEKIDGINKCTSAWGDSFTLDQVKENHPDLDIRENIAVGSIEISGSFVISDDPRDIWDKDTGEWIAYDNSDELFELLWQSASAYESSYIQGTATAMVAVNSSLGKPYAVAVSEWDRALWEDYHNRKLDIQNASMDFSNHGDIPYTILELMSE